MPMQRIIKTWWPLAASWLLMGIEQPLVSAVIARLSNPEINLAAYGGVVYPLALIIESPIIMLLAASTALSKDLDSYRKLRRFMMVAGAGLTILHLFVVFTPLYYIVVVGIIGAPPVIVEPARIGLLIMTPWTWAIAYRRFNQGVLIRFGYSKTVGVGTLVRLSADGFVLAIGYMAGSLPGIVVASAAIAAGVTSEAVYAGIVVRPVVHNELKQAKPVEEGLTLRSFISFYIPLVMTSLLTLLANPIGSAAMSRMPEALASLAAWSVVSGLIFMLRSLGIAFNEVVVALLDEVQSTANLKRFTLILASLTTLILLLIAATPLAKIWFQDISGLPAHLAELARLSIWIALPLPALSVLQSWYQGTILHGRRTGGITGSVVIYMLATGIVLGIGVAYGQIIGLYVSVAAFTLSVLTQTAWLWFRSRPHMRAMEQRDRDSLLQTVKEPAIE